MHTQECTQQWVSLPRGTVMCLVYGTDMLERLRGPVKECSAASVSCEVSDAYETTRREVVHQRKFVNAGAGLSLYIVTHFSYTKDRHQHHSHTHCARPARANRSVSERGPRGENDT